MAEQITMTISTELSTLADLLQDQANSASVHPDIVSRLRQAADEAGHAEHRARVEVEAARAEAAATRARAEEAVKALAESEQRYRYMGETIPFGVWWCNPKGEAEYVSASFLDLLNMTMEEMSKFGWTQRLVPDDVEPMMNKWMDCIRTGEPWDHEHRIIDRHGKIHTVWSKGLPVRDEEGKIIAWVGVNLDMTARKQMELELQQAKNALEEALHVKDDFLANISHELRTPLTLILGPVQRMLTESDLPEKQRHDLGVVARNARTLLKNVNDLLDLSKLDAGRMTIDYAEADLAHLARFVASHFESVAAERQIGFSLETPEALPAQADPQMLQRVLFNLLANAFKFTPEGGQVRFQLHAEGEQAVFTVEDTGPGIPEESRQTVFERFRQLDSSATRRHGGTGLGLAITHEFVRLHNGSVEVGEATGGGARFTIEIPLRAPAGEQVKPAGPLSEPEAAPGTISDLQTRGGKRPSEPVGPQGPLVLVVEDNPEMNAFIVEALRDRYRVAAAFDGEEGLKEALRLRPDLIISDIMMPKMSGEDLVREVRRQPEMENVPILLLTAKADEKLRVALLNAGAEDVLVKPFVTEELVARATGLVERKRKTEASLRENYALLHAVTEGIHDSIFVKDAQGKYLLLNSAGAGRLGKSMEQIIGHDDAALFDPATAAQIRGDDEKIMADGETLTFEESRPAEGRMRTYLTTKGPHRDSGGRIIGVLGISRDITDRKKREEELRAAKEAAEEASRAKDIFLVNMSHELRTPLAVNIGNIDLAMETEGVPEEVQEYLTTAGEAAESLLHLIQQILELRSLQEKKMEFLEKPMNVTDCCGQTIDIFLKQAERKGLDFNIRYDYALPAQLLGDCERVREILFHLVGNAVKFTEKGEVEVAVRRAEKSPVDGRWKILFQVRDSGIGIPAEMIERLFLPFSQADSSLTRRFGGAGVGLAISKGLVEQLGGEIRVESDEGKGSLFSFVLPFRVAEAEVQKDSGARRREDAGKVAVARDYQAHILIVEDEPAVSNLLRLTLTKRGWHVMTAGNGREALEVLDRDAVDVILMDLKMPVMDGFEATRRIRQREKGANIPVIALTAHALPEVREECKQAGMDDFLTKPANMHQLYSTIERHLPSSRPSASKARH